MLKLQLFQISQELFDEGFRDFQLKKHPILAGRSAKVGAQGLAPLQIYK